MSIPRWETGNGIVQKRHEDKQLRRLQWYMPQRRHFCAGVNMAVYRCVLTCNPIAHSAVLKADFNWFYRQISRQAAALLSATAWLMSQSCVRRCDVGRRPADILAQFHWHGFKHPFCAAPLQPKRDALQDAGKRLRWSRQRQAGAVIGDRSHDFILSGLIAT